MNEELGQMAENASNYKEANLLVKKYESIIRSQNKGILNIAFCQVKFLNDLENQKDSCK